MFLKLCICIDYSIKYCINSRTEQIVW